MQLAFFRIPVTGGVEAEVVNRFIRSVRLLNVHKEFVAQGDASYWALAIEYLAGDKPVVHGRSGRENMVTTRIDYKTELAPEDFALFARLREWRKHSATTEAVPVYTIFTNEQLAEMAKRRCSSLAALGAIDGIGQGRLEKYGSFVLDIIAEVAHGAGD